MIKSKVIIPVLIVFTLATGCAKKMSSEDFAQISAAWGVSLISEVLKNGERNKNETEMEQFAYRKLDEVCQKYGYSAVDYKRKAQELGKDWGDEWRNLWENFDSH
jgi:hypothetical protein